LYLIIRATSRSEGGWPPVGQRDRDGARVEDLADQAGGRERQDRDRQHEDLGQAAGVEIGDPQVDGDRVDQPQGDEDPDGQRQQGSRPVDVCADDPHVQRRDLADLLHVSGGAART
jgi:hypothetical protein